MRRQSIEPNAVVALLLLTASWAWWAWKQGAYFGTALLPGTIVLCLGGLLLIRTAPWRGRLALSRPTFVAVIGLAGLATWTLASAIWSPAPDIALADAQRVFTYLLAFGLGVWLCNLLGRRMELALLPLAVAASLVALATLITLLVGNDIPRYLAGDGTLQFPLGYRNATAAFFFIGAWPLLGLGMTRTFEWPIRGVAIGMATLCVELALLSQSRGSLIAGVAAIAVFLGLSRERTRAVCWLGLVGLPAAFVLPFLGDLFSAAQDGGPVVHDLHRAVAACAAGTVVSIAAASLAAGLGSRLTFSHDQTRRADKLVAGGLLAFVAIAAIAFVAIVGNPVSWVSQRVGEFNSGQSGTIGEGATRFSFDASSQRSDLWRVAIEDAGRDPLLGDGAGGYRYSYSKHRDSTTQNALDAHSVELETLSELGIPGLAMLLAAVGGAALGAYRTRGLGPSAASLSVVVLAAATYWFVHTSLDWFWPYPAVTAPVFCMLGCACAPGLMSPERPVRKTGRRWAGAALVVLALSAVPPYVSLQYLHSAYREWQSDLGRAYSDLDRARSFNPLALEPDLAEGAIARASGQRDLAIRAFRQAADKRPEDWAPHYFLASLYRRTAPRLATQELNKAQTLNPNEPAISSLRKRLEHPHRGG